jgi:opacity protein-like surface antigen
MSSSRRLALLLALGFAAATAASAQSSTSSSNPAAAATDAAQTQTQAAQSQGQLSVQARIRARRAQRRAAAIHEAYDHRYEAYTGIGYLRFTPGSTLERAHEYAWNVGVTRYFDQRLGVTADGRGYYATAFVGSPTNVSNNQITNPAISEYTALAGPTYRFYLQPKFSVSGRVMGGFIHGKFSGDLGSNYKGQSTQFGLWPDGNTFAASASIPVEYNLTPRVAVRVAPEYFLSGFGSTQQNSLGFTTGIAIRFGKQ